MDGEFVDGWMDGKIDSMPWNPNASSMASLQKTPFGTVNSQSVEALNKRQHVENFPQF